MSLGSFSACRDTVAGQGGTSSGLSSEYGYSLAATCSSNSAQEAPSPEQRRSARRSYRLAFGVCALVIVAVCTVVATRRTMPLATQAKLRSSVSLAEQALEHRTRVPSGASATATPLQQTLRRKPGGSGEEEPYYIGFGSNPPEYPLPYESGTWPTTYDYTGSFPKDFMWALGTSAYQVEGAYQEEGRGASIWDTFTGAYTLGMPGSDCSYCCKEAPCEPSPAMGAKGATGNVACDHYHTWRSDIALMKSMGLKNYRFSIAWPRIIPTGKLRDGKNEKGIEFYNSLIDGLVAAGITPLVTLYHWDLPQGLLDPPRKQGWYSRDENGQPNGELIPDWLDYVEICFREFGDRVKFWLTFNEPWTFLLLASGWGHAPSLPQYSNMSVDPYIGGHNVLNAHAAAVDLYRRRFQQEQRGKIGITNNCDWREPMTTDPQDVAAAERNQLFALGWLSDPIYGPDGDYPAPMREVFGSRLPQFTQEQKRLLRGSADFFGLNHYGTGFAEYEPDSPGPFSTYSHVDQSGLPHGQSGWLYGAGWGFRKLLNWIKRRYNNPPIYVTESGWSIEAHSPEDGARDPARTLYLANYTSEMRKAIYEDDVDVRGFFGWSLMDNFEWSSGYNDRFGFVYNEFHFGEESWSPAGDARQPTAGRQVRRRKDSSCFLEVLIREGKLIDPLSQDFAGCVTADVFHGLFQERDAGANACAQRIVVDPSFVSGTIAASSALGSDVGACKDGASNNSSRGTKAPLVVSFSGSTIVANFSARGGPEHLQGFWDSAAKAIEWGDGSTWEKMEEARERVFNFERQ